MTINMDAALLDFTQKMSTQRCQLVLSWKKLYHLATYSSYKGDEKFKTFHLFITCVVGSGKRERS